jgi:hypothetical protein
MYDTVRGRDCWFIVLALFSKTAISSDNSNNDNNLCSSLSQSINYNLDILGIINYNIILLQLIYFLKFYISAGAGSGNCSPAK